MGAGLVGDLLREQHPDLAGLPLEAMPSGWDNVLWRLGDDLVVRLPRRSTSVRLTLHEQRWLPELAPRLPLPVPLPLRVGVPSPRYPWPWSIVPWLEGVAGDKAAFTDPADAGRRLGAFLRRLHHPAPNGAPRNPYRGVPLAERAGKFEASVAELGPGIDTVSVRRVWDAALAATPFADPPVWLHGDLHPANVVVRDGTLAAVVDFGDVCAGDPATDVAAAWVLVPDEGRPAFFDAYGPVSADLHDRARGWAALFALMLVSIGNDPRPDSGRPTYAAAGHAALQRLCA